MEDDDSYYNYQSDHDRPCIYKIFHIVHHQVIVLTLMESVFMFLK